MSIFRPKTKLKRFTDFDSEKYAKMGFKAVFLDIDNTIAIPDSGSLSLEALNFINEIKKNKMEVLILSNNNQQRVASFVGNEDLKYLYKAYKPLPFSYLKACRILNCKPQEAIMIGDQLLTDVLGANLAHCYSIYSKQLIEEDIPITARNRKIEKFIWRHILHEEV